ncbi:FlgO family outer membrane protein [Tepidiphilus olei]|uniref:FlgO family outer membrane protein n=1 Tax=Tepidiphilus olei TaxID=2502184 RepID=UPI00115ECBDA|nr:FlgO family outer membrane protein [Tepidiphilus olei]
MIARIRAAAAALSAAALLSACSAPTSLSPSCHEILQDALFRMVAQICPGSQNIVITDFVEVDGYTTDPYGKALGESFRLAWSQRCNAPVRHVEVGDHFILDEDGFRLLTRDTERIRRDLVSEREVAVGTYRRSAGWVSLGARRIDPTDGTVRAASTGRIPEHCLDGEPPPSNGRLDLRTTVAD